MNLTPDKLSTLGCKYPNPVPNPGQIDTSKLAIPKPSRGGVDMRGLGYGKTNRKQRINLKPRKERKRVRCIIPGCYNPIGKGRHHLIQKSILVIDHELNLIDLCDEDHALADEGLISAADLFELKSQETGLSVEEILRTLSEVSGHLIYLEGDRVKVQKLITGTTRI